MGTKTARSFEETARLVQSAMKDFPRSCIMSTSGQPFCFDDKNTWRFSLIDTVHALSQINRFVGNSAEPYSVLQHSLWCMENVFPLTVGEFDVPYELWGIELALGAGSHDFAEAELGDISSPLKARPQMAFYNDMEEEVLERKRDQFAIPHPSIMQEMRIEAIDKIAFLTETRDLRGGKDYDVLPREVIKSMPAAKVRRQFMEVFTDLRTTILNNA